MKIIERDLVLKENTVIEDDLFVYGNIICEDGNWDLTCNNLTCYNIKCYNLTCYNIKCFDLNCENLYCNNLNYFAFAIAYESFKCKSHKGRRKNGFVKCLDGEVEIK